MTTRPNILFIMCDQLRADALGTAAGGAGYVDTPAIDRIAAEGTRFDCAYTNSPVCVPARISLATGLYPHNFGLWDNVPYRNGQRIGFGKGEGHMLDPDWPTWMAAVRDSGYRTALVGKTHLHFHQGDLRDREDLMHRYGIDDVDEIGGPRASVRVGSHMTARWDEQGLWQAYKDDYKARFSQKLPVAEPGAVPVDEYADTYVGQRSKAWLDTYTGESPWMLWVSFGGPHEPWDTPEPWASRYRPEDMPGMQDTPDWADTLPADSHMAQILKHHHQRYAEAGGMTDELARRLQANYAGNVALIDDQIGQILTAIEARGEMDNTIIVLVADHGEMNGDLGMVAKSNFIDAAARIPFIVRTPTTAERGPASSGTPVELLDLGATCCAWAGADWQAHHFAQDMTDAIEDAATAHRLAAVSEYGSEIMIRSERYKAMYNSEGEAYLLFDLLADPRETTNLIDDPQHTAGLAELDRSLRRHLVAHQLKEPGPRCHAWQIGEVTSQP